MEPPAAFAQDVSIFRTTGQARNPERLRLLMMVARYEGADIAQIRAHDQIYLVPKLSRFFNAYLDADAVRRADFRKAVAYVSHRFGFDPPTTPSLEEDLAAAVAIAQQAADLAYADDFVEMTDGVESCWVDTALLADAYATLALGYRYVVGVYSTDPTLGNLGEVAARLMLLAEREYGSALLAARIPAASYANRNAFTSNIGLASDLSVFVPAAAGQHEEVINSLDAISQRLKDRILLLA
jgi:hypothetical protein